MPSNVKGDLNSSQWQKTSRVPTLSRSDELEDIKCHLDLILLALEAIAEITSEAVVRAAKDLDLESVVGDRLTLWRLRSSNPKRISSGGRKKLDVEEARSMVLIICYLANQHQELLRRGVSLLEQMMEQDRPLHQTALLGNYLDRFINYYQERIDNSQNISSAALAHLAWKLLIDLLFYSGQKWSSFALDSHF